MLKAGQCWDAFLCRRSKLATRQSGHHHLSQGVRPCVSLGRGSSLWDLVDTGSRCSTHGAKNRCIIPPNKSRGVIDRFCLVILRHAGCCCSRCYVVAPCWRCSPLPRPKMEDFNEGLGYAEEGTLKYRSENSNKPCKKRGSATSHESRTKHRK